MPGSAPLCPCARLLCVTLGLSTLTEGCTSDIGFHESSSGLDQSHP